MSHPDLILRDLILSEVTEEPMLPETKEIYDRITSILPEVRMINIPPGVDEAISYKSDNGDYFLYRYSSENKSLHTVLSPSFNFGSFDTFVYLLSEHFNIQIDIMIDITTQNHIHKKEII